MKPGFSLMELLVVIFVISLLLALLFPALSRSRRLANNLVGKTRLRNIGSYALLYATDHDGRFPPSIAANGSGKDITWTLPIRMIGQDGLFGQTYRSMSTYLGSYVEDPKILFCPSAPSNDSFAEAAWLAGENWDNPENGPGKDSFHGTYSFWWNYRGYLPETQKAFIGPTRQDGGQYESRMLVSDYLGYNHWRFPGTYAGCEVFNPSDIIPERMLSMSLWRSTEINTIPEIQIKAAFTDGHVESFRMNELIPLLVTDDPEGLQPLPEMVGMGTIYLPRQHR
jgi:prepilin-type N-terminal cleavage/methylation domain-containing protein